LHLSADAVKRIISLVGGLENVRDVRELTGALRA
jgi:hypothetical protein